jgi:hypothetical protein
MIVSLLYIRQMDATFVVSFVMYFSMCHASFSNPYLVVVCRTDHIQNGQEIVDNLAELKSPIMTRYEQWRANPSSMQSRAQASNPISQPLVAHHSIIKSVTNASPSVPVPVSISPPESANCPPDSGLPVAASALELVEGSLSRYRHSKAGHDGETEEEEVAHAARTAGGHDEPIPEPETPKQRFSALHPTKIPAQRRNMSHKSTIPSVNHSDGLALPTDTLMQSEVSGPSRIVPLRNVTSRSPT